MTILQTVERLNLESAIAFFGVTVHRDQRGNIVPTVTICAQCATNEYHEEFHAHLSAIAELLRKAYLPNGRNAKATREGDESPNAAAGRLAQATGRGSGPTPLRSDVSSDNRPPSRDDRPDMCTEEARAMGCTCRVPYANSASIDPPEPVLDPWCPVHGGRDPDYELQRDRDDKFDQFAVGKEQP